MKILCWCVWVGGGGVLRFPSVTLRALFIFSLTVIYSKYLRMKQVSHPLSWVYNHIVTLHIHNVMQQKGASWHCRKLLIPVPRYVQVFNYLNSIQGRLYEMKSRSAGREIPRLVWEPKFRSDFTGARRLHPFYVSKFCSFKIAFKCPFMYA